MQLQHRIHRPFSPLRQKFTHRVDTKRRTHREQTCKPLFDRLWVKEKRCFDPATTVDEGKWVLVSQPPVPDSPVLCSVETHTHTVCVAESLLHNRHMDGNEPHATSESLSQRRRTLIRLEEQTLLRRVYLLLIFSLLLNLKELMGKKGETICWEKMKNECSQQHSEDRKQIS